MAKRHDSAMRQKRRSLRSRERNQRNVARLRTGLRKIRELIGAKKGKESRDALNSTLSLIDHSVARKALHRNAAARLKSRITRQVNAAPASSK